MTDPFGRAVVDHYHDRRDEPLVVRDGADVREHPIEAFYFEPFDPASDDGRWLTSRVRGPLLDVSAGADMFSLRDYFDRDRFGSALAVGTQSGLAGSMQGLRRWLGDLAHVTDAAATAVVDGYDPDDDACSNLLGYRADPTPGLAHRVFHFAYEDEVSETLLFRLFGPERLREATAGTGWTVVGVRRDPEGSYYRAALSKA